MNTFGCNYTKEEVLDILKYNYTVYPKRVERYFGQAQLSINYVATAPFGPPERYSWNGTRFGSNDFIFPGYDRFSGWPVKDPLLIGNIQLQHVGSAGAHTGSSVYYLWPLTPSGINGNTWNFNERIVNQFIGSQPGTGTITYFPPNFESLFYIGPGVTFTVTGNSLLSQQVVTTVALTFNGFKAWI
jgi:hypothetical protein